MMNYKHKIILFIVEGISDKDSLGLLLSKILYPYTIEFYIIKGDVTSEFHSKPYNIEAKIKRFIDLFLKDHKGIKKTDIDRVIHLVDMDGAYMDKKQITYSEEAYRNHYGKNKLLTNKVDMVIERNDRKQDVLNRLMTTNKIWGLPYNIYYFSCHLEHVLHNQLNVEKENKELMAVTFVESYLEKEEEFILFLKQLLKSKEFEDSWEYIKTGNHSMERSSNLFIGINEIMKEYIGGHTYDTNKQ